MDFESNLKNERNHSKPEPGGDAGEFRAAGALRLRSGAQTGPQEGDDRAQGQHHEAGRRPLPRDVPARRQGLPVHPVGQHDHRQLLHADGFQVSDSLSFPRHLPFFFSFTFYVV